MQVVQAGYSGSISWMLDDAMHSSGDSGTPKDIKIWGMWNILGEEVFGDASQEEVRPWYYTWSLMCRYFPQGCDVLGTTVSPDADGLFAVAATSADRKLTVAVMNVAQADRQVALNLPRPLAAASLYRYCSPDGISTDASGLPAPEQTNLSEQALTLSLPANSMVLITEMD